MSVLSVAGLFLIAGSFASAAAELVVALGVISLLVVAAFRVVALDGYGQRPAPRGVDEWSANGLPSHPYGVKMADRSRPSIGTSRRSAVGIR